MARSEISSETLRFLSFFPRYSVFEARAKDFATLNNFRSTTEQPPYRNWMVESSSSKHSSSDEDSGVSLPSPSALPFFPRKCRDSKKERRARTTFTSPQTQVLEMEYSRSEYISRPRRYELATQLQLKEVQIKIWYQNRRAKDKRIEKASWDRQCRCFGLAVNQFPTSSSGNYRLTGQQLQHPLHMFPATAASFPPLLDHFQQEVNRNVTVSVNNGKIFAVNNGKKI